MYLYGVGYVLSNAGITLPLQGQSHSMWVTESEKVAYFAEITGPRSLSIQQYSRGQILVGIFQKLTSSTLICRQDNKEHFFRFAALLIV